MEMIVLSYAGLPPLLVVSKAARGRFRKYMKCSKQLREYYMYN